MLTNENRQAEHKMNPQIKLPDAFLRQGGGFCGQPVQSTIFNDQAHKLPGRSPHGIFGFPSLVDLAFCKRIRLRGLGLGVSALSPIR